MNTATTDQFFKNKVMGHPAGLFVLFFTEMWERFSYYGMRSLLVIFLVSSIAKGGWAWSNENALSLYGTYMMGVYLTPVIGGYIADKFLGYRWAILLGALVMTIGHAAMAVETPFFLYVGIACLMIGNGLFKPNVASIVSSIYANHPEKKDGAYSIFYMGVNAGAFLGMMLCGYIGENVSWSWGFGLAGVFMFLGMIQFYFSQTIFEHIGLKPAKKAIEKQETVQVQKKEEVSDKKNIVRDRLIAAFIFSFFTVFFFACFEQGGGSMTIFAQSNTQRLLEGNAAMVFKIINSLIVVVPLLIITKVLIELFRVTFSKQKIGNLILAGSFAIVWLIVLWKLKADFSNTGSEVPASWFGALNSLFIILFSPFISKIWESKFNPSASVKFGIGLTLLGIGFGMLAYGSMGIVEGKDIKVSMIWLILAYFFHTMGELCCSPVGLSYISKLVPAKWIGFMFGVYYLFIAMGNKLSGSLGGMIDEITHKYSLSTFFLIFTIVPIVAGLLVAALNPIVKKLMHGVK